MKTKVKGYGKDEIEDDALGESGSKHNGKHNEGSVRDIDDVESISMMPTEEADREKQNNNS